MTDVLPPGPFDHHPIIGGEPAPIQEELHLSIDQQPFPGTGDKPFSEYGIFDYLVQPILALCREFSWPVVVLISLCVLIGLGVSFSTPLERALYAGGWGLFLYATGWITLYKRRTELPWPGFLLLNFLCLSGFALLGAASWKYGWLGFLVALLIIVCILLVLKYVLISRHSEEVSLVRGPPGVHPSPLPIMHTQGVGTTEKARRRDRISRLLFGPRRSERERDITIRRMAQETQMEQLQTLQEVESAKRLEMYLSLMDADPRIRAIQPGPGPQEETHLEETEWRE